MELPKHVPTYNGYGIAFDSFGNIFVANTFSHRIDRFQAIETDRIKENNIPIGLIYLSYGLYLMKEKIYRNGPFWSTSS